MSRMVHAILNTKFLTAPVAIIVKQDSEEAVSVKKKREDLFQGFLKPVYSTVARSAISSKQPSTDISRERKTEKTCSKRSERPVTEILPWNEVMARSKSTRYSAKSERVLDLTSLKVIEAINIRFAAAVKYQNDRLLEKFSGYGDDVTH